MNITAITLACALLAPIQDGAPIVIPTGGLQAPAAPRGTSQARFGQTPRGQSVHFDGSQGTLQVPVRNLMGVRGQEDNVVWGLGLVDGLAGTGDSSALAKQMLRNILLGQGINVDAGMLSTKNMAVVRVEATLPAGLKPGQKIDVRVSAYQDAKSLVGGNLIQTELFGMDELVYVIASGPVTVGGFTVEGDAATTTKNHTTAGTLPRGGKIVREVATTLVDPDGYLYLDSRPGQDQLGNVVRSAEVINSLLPGAARVSLDGKSVQVAVPGDVPEHLHGHYLNQILGLQVATESTARVVINERTGVVVMGGDVRLLPGAITRGNLIVEIAETQEVSQPSAFSTGETVPVPRTDLNVTEENNPLQIVPAAATLHEVVEVLNALGATPRDLISVLTALQEAEMLIADIRRM